MNGTLRNYVLFDDHARGHLLPFTFIRPVAEIRAGILTIREKWERWTGHSFTHMTEDYLEEMYPLVIGEENLIINGSIIPNRDLVDEISSLVCGEMLVKDNVLIAGCLDQASLETFDLSVPPGYAQKQAQSTFIRISKPWHIFRLNGENLAADFDLVTAGRTSSVISSTNQLIQPGNIFAEEGARIEYCTLNASGGPVYIGRNAEIMEGSSIRGPFALCEGGQVKMGARIYGATTIGPYSRVGGEVTNSVIFDFSNKVHEGYVGNSVIGDWCNIGAGSNTSNLKNNYALVKVWNYVTGKAEDTGLQFCGLMMGDYSRCGISTMFNTGSVIGVSSNIFGSGFPGNFVPSFSWGGAAGFETYWLIKAIETIEKAMLSRNRVISETERKIISRVFVLTDRYRKSV
jgi:UDP-N-acetylglucosamine diphosphorylase/glucosamine-1-phosphate N-acetyltransferase